jgi:hypothetical protein
VTAPLTLYGRQNCHLCELAVAVLHTLQLDAVVIDIDDTDSLGARYGLRIPVLAAAGAGELDWPFDAQKVAAFALLRNLPGAATCP